MERKMKIKLELSFDELNVISAALNNDALMYQESAIEYADDKELCIDYLESYVIRMRLKRIFDEIAMEN